MTVSTSVDRRRTFSLPRYLALAALATFAWAGNAAAEKFLVLSLVGNQLTLVSQERSAGSHMDRNKYEAVPINDTFLDDSALLAAKGAILKLRPDATVELLRARDPKAYAGRNALLDQDSTVTRELMANLAPEVAASPGVRLVLIAPLADTPRLKGDEASTTTGKGAGVGFYSGSGRVAGLGYYTGRGVAGLGMFLNMQLVVIDLQSGAIQAHERVATGVENATSLVPNSGSKSDPTASDRAIAMQTLLTEEIARQIPALFKSLPP
jgi:hypothetical protein